MKSTNYVRCGYLCAWLLFDLDNGHAHGIRDPGKGYVWVFSDRKSAVKHRSQQHQSGTNARLSQPMRVTIRRPK